FIFNRLYTNNFSMAKLKLSLGLIPSTSKIEQEENALIEEFEKLKKFSESNELKRFNELDARVNSTDFKTKKEHIVNLRFKDSEEYNKELEFRKLDKDSGLAMYFRTRDSVDLKKFREMENSDKVKRYEELSKIVSSTAFKEKQKMKPITFKTTEEYNKYREYKRLNSDSNIKTYKKLLKKGQKEEAEKLESVPSIKRFRQLEEFINSQAFLEKKNMKPITFKDSDEYKLLQEYKKLKNDPDIKFFFKFRSSKALSKFKELDGSQKVSRHAELKDYLNTDEFRERKAYLLDKKRFEKSDLYKVEEEYEKLKKSDDIVWYFKVKDSDKFDVLKHRELVFHDEFDSDSLDKGKWLTNHYWGDRLLNDRYSLESDLHCYTEADNINVGSSILSISTRPQKKEGKVWNPELGGFRNKEFNFTSGIINTGKSFRQKYGIFQAKVKLNTAIGPRHAFYLLADKVTPHIDICRTAKGKVWMDLFANGDKLAKTSIGGKYGRGFYIYTLEWTADKLVWKINDYEVFRQTYNIPSEPMYINFSGGLDKTISGSSSMEIDWVRVYRFRN
ncbi:MAG: family 16 glycosylhydrolase, partial [Bacteroidales bacterium]|nr:family 16 glycosylhydrolase [Bacteroidales bacterium]